MKLMLPQTIERKGIRVLTTKQIAKEYGVKEQQISQNFKNNRPKFIDGKHYISLSGDELKEFKKHFEKIEVVNGRASHLDLWTEKGALLHAKSLNTDKAWEVYDYLVDYYFRAEEEKKVSTPVETKSVPVIKSKPYTREVVDVPENPEVLKAIQKIRDDLTCMDVLLQYCIRYTEKKAYNKIQSAAAEVLPIIVQDWNKFFDTEPKIIQKVY